MSPAQAVWQTLAAMPVTATTTLAIRCRALTFTGDVFVSGAESALHHESDAIVAMAGGRITHFGPAAAVRSQLPAGTQITEYGRDHLILPGFIDCHVHYPQLQIIGAHGE